MILPVLKAVALSIAFQIKFALATTGGTNDSGYKNIVYFPNWGVYDRQFHPSDLPVTDISHALYAFQTLQADGTVQPSDTFADLAKLYPGDSSASGREEAHGCVGQFFHLKKKHRSLKVMLSIGGATGSANFPVVARSETGRKTFARTVVTMMKDWGFDGVDINWEHPTDDKQAEDLVCLLRGVRQELDLYAATQAEGHHFQLSIAAPAGPDLYRVLNLKAIGAIVDFINLMAYDFTGGFSTISGHTSNLDRSLDNPDATPFNINSTVQAYLQGGMPPEKIVLGIPLIGRSFENTAGIGQPFQGVGSGSWDPGVWDYKDLPRAESETYFDSESGASYTYDAKTRELISFDTPVTVEQKASYVKDMHLGGCMFWEASADRMEEGSLVRTSFKVLNNLDQTPNHIRYPDSRYANIKESMD
ncbi:hypothetical protein HIM_11009 [Hirsutella minnesotensis 3608]|uniref:chitinase n=1 Tax=Hirsutella minnesotensis 3608 TaxID=1043627 RepID=A0A0F7ZJE7_9HYPO|nr:hypothetical protein HIM_11009 [Hirsutella minnesotensis 3608]